MTIAAGTDTEVAACVLALVGANALSSHEFSEWIDGQILLRPVSPRWLLDASLAPLTEDKLHYVRLVPGAVEISQDPFLTLQAHLLAYRRGRIESEHLASRALHTAWDHRLPDDMKDAIYELDEDATCAHAHGGIPQPERVAQSIARLESHLATRRGLHELLDAYLPSAQTPEILRKVD
jgi:hypothetical protein